MSSYFDQRGQRVNAQTNIVGDVGQIKLGSVSDRGELVAELERLKSVLGTVASDESIDSNTVSEANYELTEAIEAAKQPTPRKNIILGHLGGARSLLETTGAAAGVVTAISQAVEGVQRLF